MGADANAIFQYQPLHEGLPKQVATLSYRRISIPAPPRGASIFKKSLKPEFNFNTSPSTRGFAVAAVSSAVHEFQYQPLHEGLPSLIFINVFVSIFQYQPLHEGLPGKRGWRQRSALFQYQPLHEGLRQGVPVALDKPISIPAPPRGAS